MTLSVLQICDMSISIRGRLIRLAALEGEKYRYLDNPDAILTGLRKSRERIDLFTFIQKIPDTQPRFAYPMEWDNLAALPITSFEHWWTKQISNKTRNMVRKAEKKGLVFRELPLGDALIRDIQEIYNESPVRQGKRFTHFKEDLATTYREMSTFPNNTFFIGAFLSDRMIGFVRLVTDDAGTLAGIMSILSMLRHRDKAPTNALLAQSVRSCADRSIKHLFYSSFGYGKKASDSLAEFKLNNGFQRVDVPRYYVPLTALGRAALKMGLQRPIRERLPESLLSKAREFRSFWHNRTIAGTRAA